MSQSLVLSPKVTILAPVSEAKKLGSVARVQKLKLVKAMKDGQREVLMEKIIKLSSDLAVYVKAGVAVGRDLFEIREAAPHGTFYKILRQFNIAPKTADRTIAGYENLARLVPVPVLEEFAARGVKISASNEKPLGRLTNIIRDNKPPRAAYDERVAAKDYVDVILQHDKERRGRIRKAAAKQDVEYGDPKELRGNFVRAFQRNWNALPGGEKRKLAWLEEAIGECIWFGGITSRKAFDPIKPPSDHFLAPVGRPKIVDDKANDQAQAAGA